MTWSSPSSPFLCNIPLSWEAGRHRLQEEQGQSDYIPPRRVPSAAGDNKLKEVRIVASVHDEKGRTQLLEVYFVHGNHGSQTHLRTVPYSRVLVQVEEQS